MLCNSKIIWEDATWAVPFPKRGNFVMEQQIQMNTMELTQDTDFENILSHFRLWDFRDFQTSLQAPGQIFQNKLEETS